MFLYFEFLVIARNMELFLIKKTKIKEASCCDVSLQLEKFAYDTMNFRRKFVKCL